MCLPPLGLRERLLAALHKRPDPLSGAGALETAFANPVLDANAPGQESTVAELEEETKAVEMLHEEGTCVAPYKP